MTEVDLRALRRGDEGAFRALVNEHHSTLFRLAMIYSPSPAVAEQTVRETWSAVLRGLDGFAGRASLRPAKTLRVSVRNPGLRTWICRVLVNIARRRAGRELRVSDSTGEFAAVSPDQFVASGPYAGHWKEFREDWSHLAEDRMSSRELRDVASEAIAGLPASQREVMTLRDMEGWSAAEVSDLLGIQDGHQRVLLHRARSRVRQALEDYLAPPLATA